MAKYKHWGISSKNLRANIGEAGEEKGRGLGVG